MHPRRSRRAGPVLAALGVLVIVVAAAALAVRVEDGGADCGSVVAPAEVTADGPACSDALRDRAVVVAVIGVTGLLALVIGGGLLARADGGLRSRPTTPGHDVPGGRGVPVEPRERGHLA